MPADTTYAQLRRFGHALRDARLERTRLSQENFAELAGVHRTYVGKVERAEINVSFENISRFARALRLKPSALFLRAKL